MASQEAIKAAEDWSCKYEPDCSLAELLDRFFCLGIRKAADLLEENERNADPRFGPACLDPIKGLRDYANKQEKSMGSSRG